MRAILTQVRATLRRRRTQTGVVFIVSLLAAGVATMALTLLVRSSQPWDDAFAGLNGPHLVFSLDARHVTAEQLNATAHVPGVTQGGPAMETASVPFVRGDEKGPIQVIGRAGPGGDMNRLALSTGRWPERPGEMAIVRSQSFDSPIIPVLGDTIQAVSTTQPISFRVVGEVIDLTACNNLGCTLRGWVLPGQVAPLVDGNQVRLLYEMPYRFTSAASAAELAADRARVEAALPTGSEVRAPNDWLSMRSGANWLISSVGAVIFAFSVFALLAVVLIVGSVVSGSVVAGYREIGIIKALGFTPAQVVATTLLQMLAPAAVGALVGVPIGALVSRPFLNETSASLKLPSPSAIDPVVDLLVPVGLLALVVLAAVVPARRAASVNSIRAIARGTAPTEARRSRLGGVLSKLGAPRPLSLGAGEVFARPVRASLSVLALAIGIATLMFAFSFGPTIQAMADDRASWGGAGDLQAFRYPGLSDNAAMDIIHAQPETRGVLGSKQLALSLAGRVDTEPLTAMRGDSNAFGYQAVSGRWFAQPGEAVVAALTARDRHLRIGDTVDGTIDGSAVRLHIVGVVNDVTTAGRGFRVNWATLTTAVPAASPDLYLVNLRQGGDGKAVAARIQAAAPNGLSVPDRPWIQYAAGFTGLLNALVGSLTMVLVVIAAVGVFNAVLLSTRERVHDIAILKALGMTPAQIGIMTGASALVMAAVATIIGIPAGIWLVAAIVAAMGDLYGFVVTGASGVGPVSALLVVAGAFVVALAGAGLPARWAAATPVSEVLRSE